MPPSLPHDPHADDVRVIDTEGTPVLREVAVLDGRGQLLYEARTPDDEADYYAADLIRPLPELLRDLRQHLQGHRVVAHNAPHDSGVLAASFEACGLQPPSLDWHCTLELAQQLHPGCSSFALGPLCDELQVGSEPFCRDAAHQAAYDARFTYRLYRRLQRDEHSRRLAGQQNPFHSSRVDTPFQHFVDDRKVHEAAFLRLSSVLRSVAGDQNQQSQGAVLVGEPGSGKTHLVMRLADEVLRNNRLLFVRQPNQAATVLFHIYSRTLESLVEPVGDTSHSQLDLLLIRALRRIMQDTDNSTDRDREILAALEADDLGRLGQDGSDARRQRWERLETRLLRWWADRHSAAGSGRQILQGLMRYCRYTRPDLRESCRRWLATGECEPVDRELEGLSPWNGELDREEFSLQALRVLGLLSSLDAPLILVFDQLEGLWQENNRPVLLRFAEVVKELFTHMPHTLILVALFPDRWQRFQRDFDGSITGRVGQHVIPLEAPRPDQIEEILDMRLDSLGAKAVELFSEEDLEQIVRMPSLRSGLNRASAIFEHRVNGVPLPPVPPPPPPPLRFNVDSNLSSQPRLLQLEEQIEQILERLERLERRESAQAQAHPPAAEANTEERQHAEPTFEPVVSDAPRPRAAGEIASDNPYTDLFGRYREHARDSLRERWKSPPIIDDSDDAGKLRQICLGYQQIRRLEVDTLRLAKKKVPDNVVINLQKNQYCVAFLHLANANSIQARLSNLNQLVLRHRQVQFILMRDASAPEIRSKGASAALQAFLNGCGDGVQRTHERPLDLERRLALEFVHQLVSDIINRELDVPLRDGLQLLAQFEPDNWVVKMLHPMRRAG